MADNTIYIPEVNPVMFYESDRANLEKYYTKHFEKWMFPERILDWQQPEEYCQIWQTTDIIKLQFESTFDPIVVKLLDSDGNIAIELPALIGLPNIFLPGTFSFEVSMSLADLETGCYTLLIELGTGDSQKLLVSGCQYISAEQIPNSIILEYWHSAKYHKDVVWATEIKMQYRVHGHFGFLEKTRTDTMYRDQRYNPAILQSKSVKQWPLYFGDEFGLPDDHINLIDEIFGCDNVLVDGKPFGLTDNNKSEFIEIGYEYPKRGVKYTVEEGINRNSRIYAVETDTLKKLATTIIVDAKVFGDTANQGSGNTVPVITIE